MAFGIIRGGIGDDVVRQHVNYTAHFTDTDGIKKEINAPSNYLGRIITRNLLGRGVKPPITSEIKVDPAFLEYIGRIRSRMHKPEL